MIIVLGYVHVNPAEVAGLNDALQTMMRKTREEDGCERYSLAVENAEEGIISISERWASMEALGAHSKAQHMADFNAALKGKVTKFDVKAYDASNERKLG